jgi:hypothetical protein
MRTDQVVVVVALIGLFLLVGYVQSRIETCRSLGQKTISCVLSI